MVNLKDSLERFNQLAKEIAMQEEGNLRFKAKFIPVHKVAEQYYCEKKVEMKYIYGEEETLEMKLGKKAHELLLKDAVAIKREELWRKIFSGKPVNVREMLFIKSKNNFYSILDAFMTLKAAFFLLFAKGDVH
ncbi:hypothetical protein KEJ50_05710 [Candidatus Bathyarchaeota archaeon]|nr:hypothetical protein [Candidatus Bathyarchaeota archaeon]